MIHAVIFDLDGTLVQTEELKGESYAHAAVELAPDKLDEKQVIDAFQHLVGLSRREVAEALIKQFHLEGKVRPLMEKYGVKTPWEAFVQVRLHYYDAMLADPDLIRAHQIPHNIALLNEMAKRPYKIAMATMSYWEQVDPLIQIFHWEKMFDVMVTRDDVKQGKPNPEIYQVASLKLDVAPDESLVIEDSANGVEAALAARTKVIAVSTALTHDGLHALKALDPRWLVDDPKTLMDVVKQRLAEG